MPNRILREGILTSRRVNRLKPQAEVFYRRLMSVVDDFGRYWADPSLLRAGCFPLRIDEVREADIVRLLAEVQQADLIALYAVEGESYLELLDFRQQRRAKSSKFPQPPADAEQLRSVCVADAQRMHTKARGERREARGEGEGGARGAPRAPRTSPPTEAEWLEYARAKYPDWPEHDVLSAFGHYEKLEWDGVKNWKGCVRTCYHRQAAEREAKRVPALIGAHRPAAAPPRREVTQESPLWVIAVGKALGHAARPDVPDELVAAWDRWTRGDLPEAWEPPEGWKEQLEAAVAAAVEADARLVAVGGRR